MAWTLVITRLIFYETFIFTACLFGDNFISNAYSLFGLNQQLSKALVDNLTHGIVGLMSWAIIIDFRCLVPDMTECSGCMFIAMLVDTDHFIAARSLQLKSAVTLTSRPMFHASSLIPVVAIIIFLISVIFKDPRFKVLTLMFLVASISHHIRDSTRRGLWFPPFGSTRPLPTATYMLVTMLIPIAMKFVLYVAGILRFYDDGHKWYIIPESTGNIAFV